MLVFVQEAEDVNDEKAKAISNETVIPWYSNGKYVLRPSSLIIMAWTIFIAPVLFG